MQEPTVIDWAYAAGIIDGEGCVTASHNGTSSYLQITVSMKPTVIVDWLYELFGGKRYTHTRGKYGELHYWVLSGRASQTFLVGIQPYMKLKGAQVRLGLAFVDTIGEAGIPMEDKVMLLRQHIIAGFRELNARPNIKELQ